MAFSWNISSPSSKRSVVSFTMLSHSMEYSKFDDLPNFPWPLGTFAFIWTIFSLDGISFASTRDDFNLPAISHVDSIDNHLSITSKMLPINSVLFPGVEKCLHHHHHHHHHHQPQLHFQFLQHQKFVCHLRIWIHLCFV